MKLKGKSKGDCVKMKNQVFVCETLYHVFVSLLWNEKTKSEYNESLLILGDSTPGSEGLCKRLAKSGLFDHVLHIPFGKVIQSLRKKRNIHKRLFKRKSSWRKRIETISSINEFEHVLKNAEFNLFSVMGITSAYFVLNFKYNFFRLMEDGERNYFSKIGLLKYYKRKFLFKTYIGEGHDKEIKEIHVQEPHRLPVQVRAKGVKLDLKKLQSELSHDAKKRFLNCFWERIPNLADSPLPKLLLITQPLSEDHYVSEDYKINSYKKLLKDYGEGYQVFLKTHPRETTDYQGRLGVPFIEIPRSFPLELLNFIDGISFDKGVTVYSSAINNLECIKEKIFLGMDYDSGFIQKKRIL